MFSQAAVPSIGQDDSVEWNVTLFETTSRSQAVFNLNLLTEPQRYRKIQPVDGILEHDAVDQNNQFGSFRHLYFLFCCCTARVLHVLENDMKARGSVQVVLVVF